MDARQAQTVLESMRVCDWPGVYVLGCIDRRVTIYSQQVRALNLAAALVASDKVKVDEPVVVVGAGAAGLTCAAGLRRLGAQPIVLEKKSHILSLFRLGSQRWLHPGVYDWPLHGWNRDRAGLPVLDWEHGRVDAVCQQLENEWEHEGVELHLGVEVAGIGRKGETRRRVTWGSDSVRTGTVILAVGFGLEPTPLPDERRYWEADDFDYDRAHGPQRWLVSGCGDGALTDLFRLCIQDFRHDRMLADFTDDPRMEALCKRIREIEADASIQQRPAELHDAYEKLDAPWVVEAIKHRARTHEVTLVTRTADFLSRRASPLNRFLAAQLLRAGRFKYLQDDVINASPINGRVLVQFETTADQYFDRIQRRHGPKSALEVGFPAVAKAVAGDRLDRQERPVLNDQMHKHYWTEGAFGSPPPSRGLTARIESKTLPPSVNSREGSVGRGSVDQTTDLFRLTPMVLFHGKALSLDGSFRTIAIYDFLTGDRSALDQICENFAGISPTERYLLGSSPVTARLLTQPPRWSIDSSGQLVVLVDVSPPAPTKPTDSLVDIDLLNLSSEELQRGAPLLEKLLHRHLSARRGAYRAIPRIGTELPSILASVAAPLERTVLTKVIILEIARLTRLPTLTHGEIDEAIIPGILSIDDVSILGQNDDCIIIDTTISTLSHGQHAWQMNVAK